MIVKNKFILKKYNTGIIIQARTGSKRFPKKILSKVNNKTILNSCKFLKNKDLDKILYAQKKATENIFLRKNIPFRSIEIYKRDERTLGELFCFFVLETILIAKALDINPYDQPAVELIKNETKKLLT